MTQPSYPTRIEIGETFETPTWRVHRYATSVCVMHLVNAGKRGKTCERLTIGESSKVTVLTPATSADVALRMACLAVDGVGVEEMVVEAEMLAKGAQATLDRTSFSSYHVTPAGIRTIVIHGDHVRVRAGYADWSVQDKDDTNNEPTLIPLKNKDRKPFYAWALKNEKALKTMRFHEVMSAMRADGLGYHYYLAVD
jgi:hypothetical protein